MKKRNLIWLAIIVLVGIFLTINSCKKDEKLTEDELVNIQEQQILDKIDDFMPKEIIYLFESYFNDIRHESDYVSYLDSIEKSIDELRIAVQSSFSLSEYGETLKQSLSYFNSSKNSNSIDDCYGLGYVKGVEIDLGASGSIGAGITTGLQAAGGGGVQTIYDFVNMDRQIYYHTFCSFGYSFGAGATAALSGNVGFSGINGILMGIRYHGTSSGLNKFEGPSISTSHSLSAGVAALFGIDFSIGVGMSNSAHADFSGIGNLVPCPNNMVVIENGIQGYSFQVSGSLSAGVQADLAMAYSNNSIGSNSHGSIPTYRRFSNRRPLAGIRMATEIMYAGPVPGIFSNLQGFDIVASTVAIIYGFKNFSNCPGELPTIGTFYVSDITAHSATSGGIVIHDGGSSISNRGIVWSTSGNPTILNNSGITNEGTGTGEFTSIMSGLNPNTTYYVRAYATNGAGTAYGQQVYFNTLNDGGSGSGNFNITESTHQYNSDWNAIVADEFGSDYRVADWNDLVSFYGSGGDLLGLFDALGLIEYGSSVSLYRNGQQFYSGSRAYFASRHEHNKPPSYLAHENINNYLISLGSWSGARKIMVIKN